MRTAIDACNTRSERILIGSVKRSEYVTPYDVFPGNNGSVFCRRLSGTGLPDAL